MVIYLYLVFSKMVSAIDKRTIIVLYWTW